MIGPFNPDAVADAFFGLKLPVEAKELKKRFREKALTVHSDHGGADEDFMALKAAYDFLCEYLRFDDLERPFGVENGVGCEKCEYRGYVNRLRWTLTPRDHLRKPCKICVILRSTMGCQTCDGHFSRAQGMVAVPCECRPGKKELPS